MTYVKYFIKKKIVESRKPHIRNRLRPKRSFVKIFDDEINQGRKKGYNNKYVCISIANEAINVKLKYYFCSNINN